jgi:hypothetical protein
LPGQGLTTLIRAFFVTKLLETVYQESIERVDAQQGILFGVKVLGESSRNKRRYAKEAMQGAVAKYEGVKSYVDHPDRERLSEDRKFSAWSGVFKNPRYIEGKGIYADLHLRQKGTYFEGIIEAAQKFPTAVGFSHVAEGESHLDGDTEIVESIREVFSVDLVTDPATTAGIFESVGSDARKELREAIEQLPEGELRTKLTEMMGNGYMADPMAFGQNQPADPVGQLTALVGQLTAALADALKSLAKANKPDPVPVPPAAPPSAGDEPAAEEGEEEEMSDDDKEKLAAFESLQRERAELMAKTLLLESGRQATTVRIKALANCESDAERKELLESWPTVEEVSRPKRSPGLVESDSDFPRDAEKFAALLR